MTEEEQLLSIGTRRVKEGRCAVESFVAVGCRGDYRLSSRIRCTRALNPRFIFGHV